MPRDPRGRLFITGDPGAFDERGYLSIVGGAKDLVISGGYNIYPQELELLLDGMPAVHESPVIGVPHPDMGEGLAAVPAREECHAPAIEAIKESVAGALALFKQPRRYVSSMRFPGRRWMKFRRTRYVTNSPTR